MNRSEPSTRAQRGLRHGALLAACSAALSVAPSAASAWTFDVIHHFSGKEGGSPVGQPVVDAQGNLYGTASLRNNKPGSLWTVPAGGRLTGLHWFRGGPADGKGPVGALLLDKDGNVYGTTFAGGATGAGTVFKYSPGTGYQVLLSLPGGVDGFGPAGGLTREPVSGTMYGTTEYGGEPGQECGTIFKINADTLELKTIHRFVASTDGCYPLPTLTNAAGSVLGTTYTGGPGGFGTVYKMKMNGTDFMPIPTTEGHAFRSGMAKDSDGRFWGVAGSGSPDAPNGGIFEIDSAGTYHWRYSFQETDGAIAAGTPLIGQDGKLYGTTYTGGTDNCGTIYSFDGSTQAFTVLRTLKARRDGCGAYAGLSQDTAGNLFGVAYSGGKFSLGTVFKLTP